MRHSAKCRSQSENKNWNVHPYSKYRPAIAPAEMVISPRTPENLQPAPAPGRRARAISQLRAWNPFLGNSLSLRTFYLNSMEPGVCAGCTAGERQLQKKPDAGNLRCRAFEKLREFRAGKKVSNFKRSRLGRIRTMCAVVLNAFAELLANRSGLGLGWIGRAHRLAPFCNGVFRFQYHHYRFPRAHKRRQLSKKRPLAGHRIKSFRLLLAQPQGFNRHNLKLGRVNPADNICGQASAHRVRLDNR